MAVNQKVKICWCPNYKIDEVRSLIDTYLRPQHILARDRNLLVWQYRHKLSPDELGVVVAINQEDRIVGCLGIIQTDYNYYGQRRKGIWLAIWVVNPEVRGQGLGSGMLDMVLNGGYELIGAMGYNIQAKHILTKAGFVLFESMPRCVYPVSLPTLKSLLESRTEAVTSERWAEFQAAVEQPLPEINNPSVHIIDWEDTLASQWDHDWEHTFSPKMLSNWHDSEFLKWRFIDHPIFHYSVKLAQDKQTGELKGLLIYRIETVQNRSEKILHILNLLAEDSALPCLVRTVIEAGQQNEAAFIDFFCTSTYLMQYLENLGFLRNDRVHESERLPRLFQPLDFRSTPLNMAFRADTNFPIDAETIFEQENLYFTRSDCDQDRPN